MSGEKAPPSSDTKMLKYFTPLPLSVPVRTRGIVAVFSLAGKAVTWLTGASLSIVLVQIGVAIGALTSKTMLAWSLMVVPVASPALGLT